MTIHFLILGRRTVPLTMAVATMGMRETTLEFFDVREARACRKIRNRDTSFPGMAEWLPQKFYMGEAVDSHLLSACTTDRLVFTEGRIFNGKLWICSPVWS